MKNRRPLIRGSRALLLGGAIVLSLGVLAMAITQRTVVANGAPVTSTAPDFVVTSPRDAGPETLRDAILAADRLTSRARILIRAKRIVLESPLPALINARGVEISVAEGAGIIDAARLETGAVLHIQSPASVVRGMHIVNAHATAILVNAANVELNAVAASASKVGIVVTGAGSNCTIFTSILEQNETGLLMEAGVPRVSVLSSIFRGNTRAGLWSVASAGGSATQAFDSVRALVADSVFEGNGSGVVIANQPTLLRKSRFKGNRESAILILGGTVRLEDSEIRASGGTAISVTAGRQVVIARNVLADNVASAISVRDSAVVIEGNTLRGNGFGIVSIGNETDTTPVIRDNLVAGTAGDAITVIGSAALLQRNRILENRGAGLRVLDLARGSAVTKASPQLEANVLRGNVADVPLRGTYQMPAAP